MKIEGHTHTELCPHGNGDSTVKMIERAIKLGFDEYHITEHTPLPEEFIADYAGDPENVATASLRWDQVDDYLALANSLKQKYAGDIKVTVGFEVDYLADYEDQISHFLAQVGPLTENNIISVHYLKNDAGGYYGIDYSPAELADGFAKESADGGKLYQRYLLTVLRSVQADFGTYMPTKIGHMSLIKKYQDYFSLPQDFSPTNMQVVNEILAVASKKHLKLDFNTAGLYKAYCNDIYPGQQIIKRALEKKIPLEFGSDAHSIAEVGHGHHLIEYLKN